MLDIAPTELLLVAIVALLVIGPKDLPKAMRFVGQWVGRARGVMRHFRTGFDAMVREAEIDEMQKKWAEENARIMREHPMGAIAGPEGEPQMTPKPHVSASDGVASEGAAPDSKDSPDAPHAPDAASAPQVVTHRQVASVLAPSDDAQPQSPVGDAAADDRDPAAA